MPLRKGPSALILACALALASCASRPAAPSAAESGPRPAAGASAAAADASSAKAAGPAAAPSAAPAAAGSVAARERAAAAPGATPPAMPQAAPPAAAPVSPKPAAAQASAAVKAPVAAKSAVKARRSYLEEALADYWSEALPNGAALAVKRQAGRKNAAARIVLAAGDITVDKAEEGYAALAFSTALRAAEGEAGRLYREAAAAGASLRLEADESGNLALEIGCPRDEAEGLVLCALRALADPAFGQGDFDLALREARMAARRDSGDPAVLAAAIARSVGHSLPRGTEASLAGATRDKVRRYWLSFFGPDRLSVVVVGDFAAAELGGRLAAALGRALGRAQADAEGAAKGGAAGTVPATGEGAVAPRHPLPGIAAQGLASMPGSVLLRGYFAAPSPASADYAAMAVALAALDGLLAERLGLGRPGEARLASGFATSLSEGGPGEEPGASVLVYGSAKPEAAKAAVGVAMAELSSGLCIDPASQGPARAGAAAYAPGGAAASRAPIARCIEAYRLRAIASEYGRLSSSEALAERIAEDLAAGGDGSAVFRMAERIAAVKAEDVARVAKGRLGEARVWAALGDPALLRGLGATLAGR